MAVPAAPFARPPRWSRTIANTAFACVASLALHGASLGALAWLYRSSAPLAPPTLDLRIASVYLVPGAPARDVPALPKPHKPAVEPTRPPPAFTPDAAVAAAPRAKASVETVHPTPSPAQDVVAADPTRADALNAERVPLAATRQTEPAPAARDPVPPLSATPAPDPGLAVEWRVQDWLARHRQYPRAARRSGSEGTVWVRFVLDRAGTLQGSEILESSGHIVLDRAALDLLKRAAPFPALPSDLALDEIELVLPIEYDLTRPARG